MKEIWKPIKNYEGLYEVSNNGRIRSVDRVVEFNTAYGKQERFFKGKIISQHFDGKKNYLFVILSKNGKQKMRNVHRIVAENFISNPKNYPEVNHIDENKTNNNVGNLEWCDHKYNNNYGIKSFASKGERNAMNKFSEETIKEIRSVYIHRDKEFGLTPLSKKYGISLSHLCSIVKGRRWGWVDENND